MATAITSVITTFPGEHLATLTNANTGYAFTHPVGVPVRFTIQPHVNSAAIAFIETAITDGTTSVTAADHLEIAAGGILSWVVAPEQSVKLPRATQFVLASGTAGTKVFIMAEEVD